MLLRIALLLGLASLYGCAASRYAPQTSSTARLRLVTLAPGNTSFISTRTEECSTTLGSVTNDGDQVMTVLNGNPIPALVVGSPKVLGMPGKEAYRDFTYIEIKVDADVPLPIRTNNIRQAGLSPYDIGRCSIVGTLKLERGADYELIETLDDRCSATLVRLGTEASGRISRQRVDFLSGPHACR